MINLKEKYSTAINVFLVLVSATLIFRELCTWIIVAFSVFCLLFFKRMSFPKKAINSIAIIAIPLMLEIVFFWNNEDLRLGVKSLEKSVSLLLFPIFIIGNYQHIQFQKVMKAYAVITTLLLIFFFIRYYFVYNQFFLSFYYGMNMWNMGYHFAGTMGIHAPALNMHLAFVSVCHLHFLINGYRIKSIRSQCIHLLLFMLTFVFILIVNTRIALFVSILCYMLIFLYEVLKNKNFQKLRNATVVFVITAVILGIFAANNHFMKEKYGRMIFDKLEMVGKLDQIDRPEVEVYGSLVTRLTIWKTTIELIQSNPLIGFGSSDSKAELFQYYEKTNQHFLARNQLPVHNQYLDFFLKFGILGFLGVFVYIGYIGYMAIRLKDTVVFSFFLLFFICNLTDDFLIRFDGIVFSGFWLSLFCSRYYYEKQA